MHIDLQFIKSWGAYNMGEVARFARQQAQALIDRGIALEHTALGDPGNAAASASAPARAAGATGVKGDAAAAAGAGQTVEVGEVVAEPTKAPTPARSKST